MPNSCRRGADGERELAALLRAEGYEIDRGGTTSFGAVPDLSGLPVVHIEVKRREKLNVMEAMQQAIEGNRLPCFLAVITKENPADLAVIEISQARLDAEMQHLLDKLPYLDAIRQGIIEPPRCGRCAYCRRTKKLSGPVSLAEFEKE